MPLIWKGCGPRKYFLHLEIGNLHRLALKKYADSSVTRCLSSLGLCYPFASFPPLWRRCHLGCFLNQTTRIRSSNCNMCQTALNLEPPLSVRVRYPFLVFLRTRAGDPSSSKRRERRRGRGLAVAAARRWPLKSLRKVGIVGFGIERRLRARWKRRRARGRRERKIKTPNYPSLRPNSEEESGAPKKRSPYNLPCGETSISLAPSVRHRVISRR